jgi:hypothetical protein
MWRMHVGFCCSIISTRETRRLTGKHMRLEFFSAKYYIKMTSNVTVESLQYCYYVETVCLLNLLLVSLTIVISAHYYSIPRSQEKGRFAWRMPRHIGTKTRGQNLDRCGAARLGEFWPTRYYCLLE